jgi:hypothetical protein
MINLTLEQMISMTNQRQRSFQIMIDHLKTKKNPLIIETGCLRPQHPQWGSLEVSFKDEGCSTYIFDRYINDFDGELHSVDISPEHAAYARSQVSEKTQIHCRDSVSFLWEANKLLSAENAQIDLLYLDSMDFDEERYYTSPVHHLKELCAIMSRLGSGSMLAVDDNYRTETGSRKGKGLFIIELMENSGVELLHDGVQMVWRF